MPLSKLYPKEFASFSKEAERIIDEAVAFAEQSPVLDKGVDVWAQLPATSTKWKSLTESDDRRFNELIYTALRDQFEQDDRTVLIGEDIQDRTPFTAKSYGGAFKVSRDLSTLFEGRVRNTSISEAAIVGIGTGLAVGGYRPLVEIMFGDFMTLTLDQLLQHAAKFYGMYNGQVNVPLIVRTPMGGKRGYGPTHSQSLEKFFLGIPGLFVVALNHRISPARVYGAIFAEVEHPTLVIENKILYTRSLNRRPLSGFVLEATDDGFPTLRISPAGLPPDVTILCYGGMLEDAERAMEKAFDENDILGEIICPTVLHPFQPSALLESVKQTGRLVIVEEGTSFAAFGSEAVAELVAAGAGKFALTRLGYNGIIPCSFAGELNCLPGVEEIKNALINILHES